MPETPQEVPGELADLGDRLRRRRRQLQLTQDELAKSWGIRTQTVSAWERGHRPQRRFFGKIAEFLDLRGERSVEALLSGESSKDGAPIAHSEDAPSEPTELQTLVIEAVANQLKLPGERGPEVMEMLNRLMDSVGLPGTKVVEGAAQGNLAQDKNE